jgi:hypothetical protein
MERAGKCGIGSKPSSRRRRAVRDHVLDLGPVDMGDVDAGAGGQERAEILDLLGGARHHLDRVILDQRRDIAMGGGVVAPAAPGLRKDKRAMRISRNVAKSGPVQSALRRGGEPVGVDQGLQRAASKAASRRAASALAMSEGSPSSLADLDPAPFAQIGVLVRAPTLRMATRSMACSNRSGRGAFAPRRPLPTMTWAGMSLQ